MFSRLSVPRTGRAVWRVGEYVSLAAAEVNSAAQDATKMLWDKYHPNQYVWLPIVAIGVIATIALGVFGQMAKRWKDMNA